MRGVVLLVRVPGVHHSGRIVVHGVLRELRRRVLALPYRLLLPNERLLGQLPNTKRVLTLCELALPLLLYCSQEPRVLP